MGRRVGHALDQSVVRHAQPAVQRRRQQDGRRARQLVRGLRRRRLSSGVGAKGLGRQRAHRQAGADAGDAQELAAREAPPQYVARGQRGQHLAGGREQQRAQRGAAAHKADAEGGVGGGVQQADDGHQPPLLRRRLRGGRPRRRPLPQAAAPREGKGGRKLDERQDVGAGVQEPPVGDDLPHQVEGGARGEEEQELKRDAPHFLESDRGSMAKAKEC